MKSTRSKVSSAYQRCRRQKLKCDIEKPCLLCSRAGVECITAESNVWKVNSPFLSGTKRAKDGTSTTSLRSSKTPRTSSNSNSVHVASASPRNEAPRDNVSHVIQGPQSSSTRSMIEETLRGENESARSPFNADPAIQPTEHVSSVNASEPHKRLPSLRPTSRSALPSSLASQTLSTAFSDLFNVLPSQEATMLLVDTYFDRVHWFVLLFHQQKFRGQLKLLYDNSESEASDHNLGLLSMVLAICAIGLQYLGEHRTNLLRSFDMHRESLRDHILEILSGKFLKIIALESEEAVQFCVLLGTYYLYNGQPGLAWPICGCGLRIAQALGLHRKLDPPQNSPQNQIHDIHQRIEARKRCWWAIHEVETFCCMLYGYPSSISESDYDIDYLDPEFKHSTGVELSSLHSVSDVLVDRIIDLLSYKYLMSKLSVVIRSTLSKLYKVRPEVTETRTNGLSDGSANIDQILKQVRALSIELELWFSEVELTFGLNDAPDAILNDNIQLDLDRAIGATGTQFEHCLLQFQILALNFAYENIRILINRPLLFYRGGLSNNHTLGNRGNSRTSHSFRAAMQICREAAVATSKLGDSKVFHEASKTYAVTFISMHILTAFVTLCFLNSLDPLSTEAQKSKSAMHDLMTMQASLQSQSAQAVQGLDVMKRLIAIILEKELKALTEVPSGVRTTIETSSAGSNAVPKDREFLEKTLPLNDQAKAKTPKRSRDQQHEEVTNTFNTDHVSGFVPPVDSMSVDNTSIGADKFIDEDLFLDDLKWQEQGWIWDFDIWNDFSEQ